MINLVFVALIGYLMGSIPTSVWVGKSIFKKDLRDFGSGNAGATNTYRVLGWKPALFVVLVDIGKGAVPTYFAAIWFPVPDLAPVYLQLLAGIAAVLGHCYTCFAGFRGGKGVGTAAGMLAVLFPVVLPICIGVFAITVTLSRMVSLSSIMAAVTLPMSQLIMIFGFGREVPPPLLILGLLLVPFILYTHRTNITRIINGTENRIGKPKTAGDN